MNIKLEENEYRELETIVAEHQSINNDLELINNQLKQLYMQGNQLKQMLESLKKRELVYLETLNKKYNTIFTVNDLYLFLTNKDNK